MVEPIAYPIHQLFDGEQGDQQPCERDRCVERRYGRQRWHSKARKSAQEVQITEADETQGDPEHDQSYGDLDRKTWDAVKGFGYRGEVQMIVAPRSHRRADKDAIDEESGRDLL